MFLQQGPHARTICVCRHALQVAFDPLDGSSIFSANFAVGSIFGIWQGSSPLGQTGRDQVAAAYSIYGPRTLLVVAIPAAGAAGSCAAQPGQQQQQPQQQEQPQQQQQELQPAGLRQQQQPSQLFDVLEFALCSEGKRWKLRQVRSGAVVPVRTCLCCSQTVLIAGIAQGHGAAYAASCSCPC